MGRFELTWVSLGCAVLLAGGCTGGPSALEPPSVDPDDAAEQAMELYDKDGDGFLAGAELDAAAGVKAAMETIDTDQDGKATADEISARIEAWGKTGTGLTTCDFRVTLEGKPLEGAKVTFDPEPFLGEEFKAAVGQTNANGDVSVTIPKDQRVPADAPPGLYLGLYKVRFSKMVNGAESLPAKFNTETIIGQQIAPDDPAVAEQRVKFDLKK
jgi:hypothetical protein